MKWHPTRPGNKITARKFVGDSWIDMEMKDLIPGDIFRAVSPSGELIHPVTHEPDDDAVALVTDYPTKNDLNQTGSLLGAVGYGVPIEAFDSMEELKHRGLS